MTIINDTAPVKYFHIHRDARNRYQIGDEFFSLRGNVVIANFTQARLLSEKINKRRAEEGSKEPPVTPGLVNAMGLLHEIYHMVFQHYSEKENPGVFHKGYDYLLSQLGEDDTQKVLHQFVTHFPPPAVAQGRYTPEEYLKGNTGATPNRLIILEELIILHLENLNPAVSALKELFNDEVLKQDTPYVQFISATKEFFKEETPFGIEGVSVIEALERSIFSSPESIEAQIGFFLNRYKIVLDEAVLVRLLAGTDLIREDAKLFAVHGTFGTPPVPQFLAGMTPEELSKAGGTGVASIWDEVNYSYLETERFTQDTDWMPNVVMIAKNTYVWLDQLSGIYRREIKRLDQIPDEELNTLAARNFNALWLIGVWERCTASKKIKQYCGNPDAAPSAYSLFDYDIAYDLGGYQAYENLRDRCAQRGIRLASDMVPNHTGIFSRWILDNPDFFIQSHTPPFPSYSFTGPDLSDDPRVQIRIEDKYYTRQDAAVVFQLIENSNGRTRYLYHGNDGTNMPWNDTAQLNLLNPQVRESLINTIIKVARQFPIIRFDAAMTLAKKHYQRLWFPQPGTGGAIPSRSDYALTREGFDRAMPEEFWREVVDRMNAEMPNTLLLAEAFWLMEGYFVRTLGMHRVYNSAFMHMFMKEENAKYREVIKNTIEFDPEILKRYVNFMSNPDEETAINQFGKGDKYFGVAVMMITLPGLPMFAHGQIEGFTEKYGMEYQRAYYSEIPDQYLIDRHREEIFPLLKKRYLFSDAEHFELYDFINPFDGVNENVIAFSNRKGDERCIVVYNNSYSQTEGSINFSARKAVKLHGTDQKETVSRSLASSLNLKSSPYHYYTFRDTRTKLEYIRSSSELQRDGYTVKLLGYQYAVLIDFKEVYDSEGEYAKLCSALGGRGVASIDVALREQKLAPVHTVFRQLITKETLLSLRKETILPPAAGKKHPEEVLVSVEIRNAIHDFLTTAGTHLGTKTNCTKTIQRLEQDLQRLSELFYFLNDYTIGDAKKKFPLIETLYLHRSNGNDAYIDLLIIYAVLRRLMMDLSATMTDVKPFEVFRKLMLSEPLWQSVIRISDDYTTVKQEFDLLHILSEGVSLFKTKRIIGAFVNKKNSETSLLLDGRDEFVSLLAKDSIKAFLWHHRAGDEFYFNKEQYELLLYWSFILDLFDKTGYLSEKEASRPKRKGAKPGSVFRKAEFKRMVKEMTAYVKTLTSLAAIAGYKYDSLSDQLQEEEPQGKGK